MKKAFIALVLLTVAAAGQAGLVDDFEDYALGNVGDVASPPWQTNEAVFYANIQIDITTNQFMSQGGSSDYRDVSIALPFTVSTTCILSFDIYAKSDVNVNDAFGLTDGTPGTASADDYPDFGPYIRITDDSAGAAEKVSLDTRDDSVSGGFVNDIAALDIDKWYTIKLVIDTAGGDEGNGGWDVYLDDVLVYSDADFRKDYTDPLESFLFMSGNDSGGQVLLDNIHIVPEPATLALLGMGGLTLLRKRR